MIENPNTPRADAAYRKSIQALHEEARALELELVDAKNRIKKLENEVFKLPVAV